MPEKYFVDCRCGSRIRVELYDAGAEKVCGSCGAMVKVPDSNRLKEQAGDKYPLLRPIEKVRRTVAAGEPPFDGTCHGCDERRAAFSTPCTLDVMVERHVSDDGGIRPTMTGGVKLVAGASEETWERTTFPLLLCEDCQTRFESDRRRAGRSAALKVAALLGLLAAFAYFAYRHAALVATLSGVFWLVGAIAWAARFRDSRKIDPFLRRWLRDVRWVSDVVAEEDEFTLTIGPKSASGANRRASPSESY